MSAIETYRGVVFPWLADQMGHLTTSRYVEMFDVASYHLLHIAGLGHDSECRTGLADVRQEIDYREEVLVGGLTMIRSGFVSLGRTSFRTRHVMTGADGSVIHSVLEAVTVRFDLAARQSLPLPEGFAERIVDLMIEGQN